jgi:hypothetical protein
VLHQPQRPHDKHVGVSDETAEQDRGKPRPQPPPITEAPSHDGSLGHPSAGNQANEEITKDRRPPGDAGLTTLRV